MKKILKNKNNGFIALLSVVIISFVLLLIAITLSFTSFLARFNILDTESKEKSSDLAEACIFVAQLQILKDKNTEGSKIINIDDKTCQYTINQNGSVVASAQINNSFTFFYAFFDKTQLDIPMRSFKECANLASCP